MKKPRDSIILDSSNGDDRKPEPMSFSFPNDESGPFIWGRTLGSGASGTVHQCVDIRNGREVACKVIRTKKTPIGVATPFVEIAALIALRDCPGIVQLEDFYGGKKTIVLTLELCRGGDLLDRINLRGPYSEFQAAKVFATLSEIVRNCHSKNIMHRDLKPENVLLKSMESDSDIRLADFGQVAFFEEGVPLTDPVGTFLYHSPEVINGSYGVESDIWCLGVILYVLLSGEQPFQKTTLDLTVESIAKGNFSVKKGNWRKISPLAIDLVTRILTVDVKKRITLSEILRHPWILRNSVKKRSFSDLTSEMSHSYIKELYSNPLPNLHVQNYTVYRY